RAGDPDRDAAATTHLATARRDGVPSRAAADRRPREPGAAAACDERRGGAAHFETAPRPTAPRPAAAGGPATQSTADRTANGACGEAHPASACHRPPESPARVGTDPATRTPHRLSTVRNNQQGGITMQRTTRIASTLLAGCSLAIASCSMTTEGQEQLAGAGIGAATGAALRAAARGGNGRAIAIGAGSGAVAGWGAVKLAQMASKRTQSAQQENSIQGWKPGDPARVKMRGVYVRPDPAGPGSQTTIAMNYGVTGP